MKVGLLGGSFNPPHIGHLHISQLAIKKLNLNQIWWIPTLYNDLKDRKIYDHYDARLEKCREITKMSPKIYVKEYSEIHTVKLVQMLFKKYKNIEFYWIMGADSFLRLHEWEDFEKLVKMIPIILVSRETFLKKIRQAKAFKFCDQKNLQIFNTKNLNISSTQIRNNEKLHN